MLDSRFLGQDTLQAALTHVWERANAKKTCLTYENPGGNVTEVSYGEMADKISRTGMYFKNCNLEQGSRIFIASQDDFNTALLFLTCQYYGYCAVIGNINAPSDELMAQIEASQPHIACIDKRVAADITPPPDCGMVTVTDTQSGGSGLFAKLLGRKTDPTDIRAYPNLLEKTSPLTPPEKIEDTLDAYVLFTSGTTARPKGVRISRMALLSHLKTLTHQLGYGPGCRLLNILPFNHTDGLIHGWATAWCNGATCLRPLKFEYGRIPDLFDAVYTWRATHFILVPTILSLLIRHGKGYRDAFNTTDFRFIVSSAGPLFADLWQRFETRFGVRVCNIYGLTETVVGGLFSGPDESTFRHGSIGKPIDCDVRLVDDNGHDVPEGKSGELIMAGTHIMTGYLFDRHTTDAVLEQGWFHTGDLARRDADGFYYIVGRKKNIIITGGQNVQPEEVNAVLQGIDGIEDSVVFGIEDETFGETVAALVVPEPGKSLDPEGIAKVCREKLSAYKVPRTIELVDTLPRTPSGKVRIDEARKAIIEFLRESDHQYTETDSKVIQAAARAFNTTARMLSADSKPNVTDGWDSLSHMLLCLELENTFNIKLRATDIIGIKSLGDAQELVRDYQQ
jgi:long-chain acyl-CoA synthetase